MIKQLQIIKSNILVLFLILPVLGFSQKWKLARTEIIGGVGTVNYFGDIGGAESADASAISDLDINTTRPNFALGLRYRIEDKATVRGNFTYAMFKGSDEKSLNAARNYTFKTNFFEVTGYFEYWILPEKQIVQYSTMTLRDGLRKFNQSFSLYVFAGLGAAYFKPIAEDNFVNSTRFVDDKNFALVLPVGLGFKYPLSAENFIGFELSGRLTTTDYIDGFSPEKSETKDMYYFSLLYVTHKIKPKKSRKSIVRF